MYIILPTNQLSDQLKQRLDKLMQQQLDKRYEKYKNLFSKKVVSGIVEGIAEEYVLNPLYWTDCVDYLRDRLELALEPLVDDGYDCTKLFKHIYVEVLDDYYNFITSIIDEKISMKNEDAHWQVWYTFHLNNDLVLESGRDYRVLDWEHKVMDGKIDAPIGFYKRMNNTDRRKLLESRLDETKDKINRAPIHSTMTAFVSQQEMLGEESVQGLLSRTKK